jgi:hypothetical protein
MHPAKSKLDAMGYLLGGVGLLAISFVPIMMLGISAVQPIANLILGFYWLLGGVGLWWALRRFTSIGERVVAVIGVVVGWYLLLQILFVLETMVFRF